MTTGITDIEWLDAKVCGQADEIERLRAALERIRGYTSEHGGAAKALKEIRAALEKNDE